ncbi:hypothetical protein HMPREF7215_2640 [Pyramidobacter piscolens W5455]|uniref:Uncharacterized protein n=1 Tax=Pyramidobacter piscolens W5455 TaxID=352165 RepID=A0ABM9ZVG2_9BACT|nr:hypothetical protein HMPREF7215_2640 [Pyramidobacter piscolens W5455]
MSILILIFNKKTSLKCRTEHALRRGTSPSERFEESYLH